ncbi:ATP-dependent RNA helicase DBP7 [Pyricularia oryzae 70-15]|uniref:ATP-dependent RNA helicase DBP7 n=3 Tax=Pyricularia oryzae TaxID=318829 RepID=DBP7_PYRO7|nr:ATP-dependent RNA helicase DBP7 [Pyricularia oryzae 70-15]A4QX49.1 RecName: Full=ATP-dependent RNA helicase DBP7 [Pyricularia oryzae 70-15]ELQ43572.1 ATP-dependent RNA helicase dbp-7 [Pyricularia oryzae Y34]KAI7914163.1 ATP-dependent RNA helicase DBP7 [Pyricularia oryzae]EHA52318.1 ATP-dependent RNA helicase DBP7 [Pyricularia oryzae 70-15]KAI7914798.1 ATP-dependent RNA helicase DBP7 [Pyricularia oryzae]
MDDDGLLINFEVGEGPIKPQIKFTGGRWRERNRLQRSVKRGLTGSQSNDAVADDVGPAPAKRQRLSEGAAPEIQRRFRPQAQGPRSQHVSSRLFTSNPTPVTNFDEPETAPAEEPAEPALPSNAPLSDEAATFAALGLSRRIAQHLSAKLELKAPTAIQHRAVPHLVTTDEDAFLQAQTGSGKTLAYLLPIVNRILALNQNEDGTISKDASKKIHRNSGLLAIVLAPTRELCKQIATVLEKLLRCAPWIVSTTVIGGESKHSEKARIRKGINILIATPGRLKDHLDNTKVLDVSLARWLILDEGDRMMEMGFMDDLKEIVSKMREAPLKKINPDGIQLEPALPTRRVTVLCSATLDHAQVRRLGEYSLEADKTELIKVDGTEAAKEGDEASEAVFAAPSQLKQSYLVVPAKLRLVTLIALLKSSFARRGSVMKAIIFISCADSVDFHFDLLRSPIKEPKEAAAPPTPKKAPKDAGETPDTPPKETKPTKPVTNHTESTVGKACYITSAANTTITLHKLHGSLAQPVRTATLDSFSKSKDPSILITTDISSRGLDVPAVDLVIEYDPAFAVADHVHRIGRTARAGRPGKAVLFLQPGSEEGYVGLLQKNASTALTPQLYDSVLQAGFSSNIDLPPVTATNEDGQDTEQQKQLDSRKQTWTSRAEALQLHLEQRLLASDASSQASNNSGKGFNSKKGASTKLGKPAPKSSDGATGTLLASGRQAFRSHIRAYATHVRDERVYFDMTQLHLGHMAKAFGLREAPGGIGAGVQRRTVKPSAANGGGKKSTKGDDGDGLDKQDDDEAERTRRMKKMMRMVGAGASEFNIG